MAGSKSDKQKGKKGGGPTTSPMEAWVAKAKGLGAVIGFAVAFWVCRGQGFSVPDAILRGLGGAMVMSLVAWRSALMVIQALMRAAVAQGERETQAAMAAAAAAQQAADASYGRRPSDGGAGDIS